MCSSTLWMQMIQIHSARSTQYAGCCRGLGPVIFLRFSLNKIDRLSDETILTLRSTFPGAYLVSAHTGEGIDKLVEAIEAGLPIPSQRVDVVIPYARGDLMDHLATSTTTELSDSLITLLMAFMSSLTFTLL